MSVPLTDLRADAVDIAPLIEVGVPLDFNTDMSGFTDVHMSPNYASPASGASVSSPTNPTGVSSIIDGNDATAWVAVLPGDGAQFIIDLGSVRTIHVIHFVSGPDETQTLSGTVNVEFSTNGTTWFNLTATEFSPDSYFGDFGAIAARYWRFTDVSGSFYHPVDGWTVFTVEIGELAPVDPTDPIFSGDYINPPSEYGWKTGWAKIDYRGIGAVFPQVVFDISETDAVLVVWADDGFGTLTEWDRVHQDVLEMELMDGLFWIEVSFGSSDPWAYIDYSLVGTFTSDTVGLGETTEPPETGPHNVLVRVEILYDGTDITEICSVPNSWFESASNGNPGSSEIWVKDLEHTQRFVTGRDLALKLDGQYEWQGYVAQVRRRYAFPADDTVTRPVGLVPRWLVIEGVDLNILFSKRVIYNKANPTLEIPVYKPGTHDDVIIGDMVTQYLDLDGDEIDTSSGVHHVGTSQLDNEGAPINAAQSWGEAMRLVAMLPGAIFYITPDRVLLYADVDIETAPFVLSDTPDGETSFGYRDITIDNDGTWLGNDALVWGGGKGTEVAHFQRYQNGTSQGIHDRWQWSDRLPAMWEDESLHLRAQSYVEGSSQNHRGHKDDALGCELTLFKPGLRVGQIVRVISNTWDGFNELLPIRRMRITFPASHGVNDDGHFMSYVQFLVNPTRLIDDPWVTGEKTPFKPPQRPLPPPVQCDVVPGPAVKTGSVTGNVVVSQSWRRLTDESGTTWDQLLGDDPLIDQRGALMDGTLRSQNIQFITYSFGSVPQGTPARIKFKIDRFDPALAGWAPASDPPVLNDPLAPYDVNPPWMGWQLQWQVQFGHWGDSQPDLVGAEDGAVVASGLWNPYVDGINLSLEDVEFPYPIIDGKIQLILRWDIPGGVVWPGYQSYAFFSDPQDHFPTPTVAIYSNTLTADLYEFGQTPVNCVYPALGGQFCEAPKYAGHGNYYELLRNPVGDSPTVYFDGRRLTIGLDYKLFPPIDLGGTKGLMVIISAPLALGGGAESIPPGDQHTRLSVCYQIRDLNKFELPKSNPKYNKHPGYHPQFLPQMGWGTPFDNVNCTCASAAMWLDAVTGGATQITPPDIRDHQSDFDGGIGLDDAAEALAYYGQTLHVHWAGSTDSFDTALTAGPVMMAGLYSQIPFQYNSDLPFTGGHCMLALVWSDLKDTVLVYDPLNTAAIWMPREVVENYMLAWGNGVCQFGGVI